MFRNRILLALNKFASRPCGRPPKNEVSLELKDATILDPKKEVYEQFPIPEKARIIEEEGGRQSGLRLMPDCYRLNRTARIHRRTKNVMQQGTDNTRTWIMEFDTRQRWENPLMGWTSSGDSLSNFHMEFPSLCAAICFAEKQGFQWSYEKPQVKKELKKSYATNFTWNKRTRVSTK